jgi:hypothetical protein
LGGGVLCFFSCQLGLLFDELGGIEFVLLFVESQHELVKFCKHQFVSFHVVWQISKNDNLLLAILGFMFCLLLHKLAKAIVCNL